MTTLSSTLEKNWLDIIGAEFDLLYMANLEQFLQREKDARRTIYPKDEEIFNALNSTAFESIKVVIIGQDPYHGEDQANGLCFSVARTLICHRALEISTERLNVTVASRCPMAT
jgi:uracil-DNA glycosylase